MLNRQAGVTRALYRLTISPEGKNNVATIERKQVLLKTAGLFDAAHLSTMSVGRFFQPSGGHSERHG